MKNAGDTVSNQIAAIHSVHGNERALSQVGALNEPLLAFSSSFGKKTWTFFTLGNKENPPRGSKSMEREREREINHRDQKTYDVIN